MELPRNSLRYLLGLILFGILFTLWCGLQGTEHGRLLSTAVSLPLRYLEQQISPRDEFAADETENDWKAMPDERNGPLPPPRWPELDSSMPTNPLWPSDPDCSMYNVSFPLKVRKTFLVSFPRSGNSWTRYLIEGATGLVTGAVFKEKLYHFDMKNDPVKLEGKVILTKIHSNNRRTVPDDVPVILLLRNPAKFCPSRQPPDFQMDKVGRGPTRVLPATAGDPLRGAEGGSDRAGAESSRVPRHSGGRGSPGLPATPLARDRLGTAETGRPVHPSAEASDGRGCGKYF
ncbi:WSCD family member AGAP003962-like isoform X2 [Penaeus japonicus]|uniref:WSCD family member AGAP003962-like isoform X2 n=1 Tax=Penaeus japonicus TaxID=27405 RepID=UPI001C7145C7|nr:WSCD family member AGAP003962-like isoform X2 [Penaeus japonicus]